MLGPLAAAAQNGTYMRSDCNPNCDLTPGQLNVTRWTERDEHFQFVQLETTRSHQTSPDVMDSV